MASGGPRTGRRGPQSVSQWALPPFLSSALAAGNFGPECPTHWPLSERSPSLAIPAASELFEFASLLGPLAATGFQLALPPPARSFRDASHAGPRELPPHTALAAEPLLRRRRRLLLLCCPHGGAPRRSLVPRFLGRLHPFLPLPARQWFVPAASCGESRLADSIRFRRPSFAPSRSFPRFRLFRYCFFDIRLPLFSLLCLRRTRTGWRSPNLNVDYFGRLAAGNVSAFSLIVWFANHATLFGAALQLSMQSPGSIPPNPFIRDVILIEHFKGF